jgi:isopenicillin N synthase-like dioxygenase
MGMSTQNSRIFAQDTAVLKTIDLSKLLGNDPEELASLLSACENEGVFYLNQSGTEIKGIWPQAQEIFAIIQECFDQSLDDKLKFDVTKFGISEINGYIISCIG